MKNEIDTKPETHRKSKDCTCYECLASETINFLNKKRERDVQLEQERKEQNQIK